MPNHIMNVLHIEEHGQKLKEIKDFIKGEDEADKSEKYVSFQQIKPMPLELEANPATGVSDDISKEEAKRRKLLYGASDWYDWHIKYWGTKWDCYDVIQLCANEFEFHTAWSTPMEIIKYLSRKFPTTQFGMEFADEDIGTNCGSYSYLDGKIIYENYPTPFSEEAIRYACNINGYSAEDTKEEIKNWRRNNSATASKTTMCPECGSKKNME